jgi:hypothetical protein
LPIGRKEASMGFSRVLPGALGVFMGIAALAGPSAFAHTVSFLVIETGIRQENPAVESTVIWENGLMDAFFDAGHIVSNARNLRISRHPSKDFPDEARGDLEEAREGMVDYFILAFLDYRGTEVPGTSVPGEGVPGGSRASKPQQVSLRVFKVNPYGKIYEQGYTGAMKDESVRAKKAAGLILPHLRDR